MSGAGAKPGACLLSAVGIITKKAMTWAASEPALAKSLDAEQITRSLPMDFPNKESMRISPGAIYQALFV